MDIFLTTAIGVIQLLLAGMGIYMSLEPQQISKHKWPIITAFGFIGMLGISATVWQQHLGKIESEEQKIIAIKLQEDLSKSNLSQEFMKGQLSGISQITKKISQAVSNPGIKQMAVAIEKIAQSSPAVPLAGNLKQRTNALHNEIMQAVGFCGFRSDGTLEKIDPAQIGPTTSSIWKQWSQSARNLSHVFRHKYFEKVLYIRNEFSTLHIRNEQLDDFFRQQAVIEDANKQMATMQRPQGSIIEVNPTEILEVAKCLKRLGELLPDRP